MRATILLTLTLLLTTACTPGTYQVNIRTTTPPPQPEQHYVTQPVHPEWPYCLHHYTHEIRTVYNARQIYISNHTRWCTY